MHSQTALHLQQRVLQLDIQGTPQAWITTQEAALHYARDAVVWEDGDSPLTTLHGGWNSVLGRESSMVIHPIIALRGAPKRNLFEIPPAITKAKLIVRDQNRCAYCNNVFKDNDLEAEHIIPASRGGLHRWENMVISCHFCNSFKSNRLPHEAKMTLHYLPYVPSRYEDFLLAGRNIRADVNVWLRSKLPKN